MNKKSIYLDYNATTPLRAEPLDAMRPYLSDVFGNASSMHVFGQQARKGLEDARQAVARCVNAQKPGEIIFTGCGTESDNMAIKSVARANKARGNHIITSSIEHHAVLATCEYMRSEGFQVTVLPVDSSGRVSPLEVKRNIQPSTILVSIMHANNEVGVIQPVAEIGKIIAGENDSRAAAGRGQVLFHTDAVQTAGKIPIDVQAMGVDLLSLSAHKFYGPKGVGALYIKRGTVIEPLLHGGHHEANLRAGTENVAGIVGMAEALRLAVSGQEAEQERLAVLRNKLENGIMSEIPSVYVNGHPRERLAGTLSVSFEFIEGESLLLSLDLKGVAASTGSACASGASEPSHVLAAMGVPLERAQGALRFSLGHGTTEKDIDYVLEILPPVVDRLRRMSPLWK